MENIIKQKLIERGFSEKTLLNNRGLIGACIEETKEQLIIPIVSKSLPKYLQKCNRVEVIDQKGRSYVNWKPTNKVEISLQDDDRTAKIFITG